MPNMRAAEKFLALFTTREQASAIAGDMVEQHEGSWLAVFRTGASLFGRNVTAQPLAVLLLVAGPVFGLAALQVAPLILVQLLLLASLLLFVTAPLAFVALVCSYLFTGERGRGAMVTGAFVVGAAACGFVVWHLVPSSWTLPFWTTLEATVDSETYGHPVEHAAEQIMMVLMILALAGGVAGAGAAALGTRQRRTSARA